MDFIVKKREPGKTFIIKTDIELKKTQTWVGKACDHTCMRSHMPYYALFAHDSFIFHTTDIDNDNKAVSDS